MERIERAIETYWAHYQPGSREIRVTESTQFHGGASRETFRLVLHFLDHTDAPREHRLILRVMPVGCLLSHEVSELDTEFHAMRAVHGRGIPVPEAIVLENDPRWLGAPFMLVEDIAGCETSATALARAPFATHAATFGEQFWRNLGTLAQIRPDECGLEQRWDKPDPATCWERELAVWAREASRYPWPPLPVFDAGLRWLRRHPPPPAERISIVHGDYRAGNFLYNAEGEIRGILDWELCHLGDPLEDVAWAMLPSWSGGDPRPGRLLPRADALAIWEAASGLRADPEALLWWEVFSAVKLVVPMVNAGIEYRDERNGNPQLVIAAWYALNTALASVVDKLKASI